MEEIDLKEMFDFFKSRLLWIIVSIIIVLNSFNISNKFIISIVLCLVFAILDETHQIFTSGRTPLLLDILIDSIGSIVGIVIIKKTIMK